MHILLHDDSKLRKFITGYILIGFGLFLFMYLNSQNILSRPVNTFTAFSVKAMAEVFNLESSIEQRTYTRERGNDIIFVPTTILRVGNYKARVILECSAVHAGILLLTFLLAYPSSVSQKISGIFFLVPCLIFFNTARIFILMLLGHTFGQNSSAFNLFHVYIMQVLIIALVLAMALLWLRKYELNKMDSLAWFSLRFLVISMGLTILWFFLNKKMDFHSESIKYVIFPFLIFGSLVLSSSELKFQNNFKEILMGLGVMIAFLIIGQTVRFISEHFHSSIAELSFVMLNSALKYILPFGLFFFLMRKKLFMQTNHSGKQVFGCPLCDKKNIRNLRAHAQAKHYAEFTRGDERLVKAIQVVEKILQRGQSDPKRCL
ncbi:MAG: archaeosortase/exosortase family protein [Pseudomonadota bacterium]